MAIIGTGAGITFDSGFFAEILEFNGPSLSRASYDTSHLGTTTAMTYAPGTLFDGGELSVSIAFDPKTRPPIDDDSETVTITWSNSDTWEFSGFMTGFTPTNPLEDRATADCTIKVTGDITVTDVS